MQAHKISAVSTTRRPRRSSAGVRFRILSAAAALFAERGYGDAIFHDGLFAYNGIGAFWIPFAIFFGWMIAMSVLTLQAINRQRALSAVEQSPVMSPA